MGRRPAVIKGGTVAEVERRALRRFDLVDVMQDAEAVLVAARAEAERIARDAEAEAQRIRQAARQEGWADGLGKGREAGRVEAFEAARREFAEQQRNLIESCRHTIASINEGRAAWEASARQDLIDLAMAIARRVAHRVGQRDREVVLASIAEAIRLAGARSEVTIAVNAADVEAARQFAESLLRQRDEWKHARVVEDPEVSPGGCRVQWGSGAVDARLETQLDRIEAELAPGTRAEGDAREDSADS